MNLLKERNHTVRYTIDRERVSSIGCSVCAKMQLKEHYDINVLVNKERSADVKNLKIFLFYFDMYIKQNEVKIYKIQEGFEGEEKIELNNVYWNIKDDRYDCNVEIAKLSEGENVIIVEINEHPVLKSTFTFN